MFRISVRCAIILSVIVRYVRVNDQMCYMYSMRPQFASHHLGYRALTKLSYRKI